MTEFKSAFASRLDKMLEYREIRGLKRDTYLGSLVMFDRFCCENYSEVAELNSEIVLSWIATETKSGVTISTNRMTAIRLFGKYLCAVGEEAYVLPEKYAGGHKIETPYIFTDSELTSLFSAIDTLPKNEREPYLTEIAPVMFRLNYTCGLRPQESRELLTQNVNLRTGEILVTQTKRNKERIVVMSDDMLKFAREYDVKRNIFGGNSKYFFPSKTDEPFKNAALAGKFS